jgi:hypothetical protein
MERKALQGAILLLALVPIAAGIAGIIFGASMVDMSAGGASADSHFRYLSGLLLGVGIGFWSCVPDIEHRGPRIRIMTLIVVIGGLARLWSLVDTGVPLRPMQLALVMELGVTPAICLWQMRVERRFQRLSRASGPR